MSRGIIGNKQVILTNLEINQINLGSAGFSEEVPIGCKSLISVYGTEGEIENVKKLLPHLTAWKGSDVLFYGFDSLGLKVIKYTQSRKSEKNKFGKATPKKHASVNWSGDKVSVEIVPTGATTQLPGQKYVGRWVITEKNENKFQREISEYLKEHD